MVPGFFSNILASKYIKERSRIKSSISRHLVAVNLLKIVEAILRNVWHLLMSRPKISLYR